MLDFLDIRTKMTKKQDGTKVVYICPEFLVKSNIEDLMIRGRDFYAIWDEEAGLWNTSEGRAIQLIDNELYSYYECNKDRLSDYRVEVKYLYMSSTGSIDAWHKYVQKQMRDNFHQLDSKVVFNNTEVKKSDYVTRKLSYDLAEGSHDAYDRLVNVIFDKDELEKLEWAVGSIIAGDSKNIQKFIVLYGDAGTGKSTYINIIQQLFDGYYCMFEAKVLGSANNQFALEAFKENPLIAIQHDGDLSHIVDNTKLNSIISHEYMTVNEKYKSHYVMKFQSFLFMGTNEPVDISGARTGMNRRLIDVRPTGNKVPVNEYEKLIERIKFELGAIAKHCLDIYTKLGKDYYNQYVARDMKAETDDFYNFLIDDYYDTIKGQEGVQLSEVWTRYKQWCDQMSVKYPMSYKKLKSELKAYFEEYHERYILDGHKIRNYYVGFRKDKIGITNTVERKEEVIQEEDWLDLRKDIPSIFDKECADCIAQYSNEDEKRERPSWKWDNVKTKLKDLDTHKLHYVKVPENMVVIDFDIRDSEGNKSFELNKIAASKWPKTYAETSKSDGGIHLHYIYGGDVSKLSSVYDEHIEVKIQKGNASLRRKLTRCNDIPIATINAGLPLKEKNTKMVNGEAVKTERHLRIMIKKCLNKEIHANTKPNIDFIYKLLKDAYDSGLHYDVTDTKQAVLYFAASSTNNSEYCIDLVSKMPFKSDDISDNNENFEVDEIVFYDIEVFPNLFVINYKKLGEQYDVIRMINPSANEVKNLLKYKLVGFNNRRYDNHIVYAAANGYSIEGLFDLSQKIINLQQGFFGEAYNLSYADIYDFCSKKQSLKKWEIELGIHHQELGLPWDKPVPEELWDKVAEYCDNDVIATEAVWNARQEDFVARQVLADISGLTVNDTTRQHATRIIFGKEKHPDLVYTDLSEEFPGYEFKLGKSSYRGEDPGEGGYVYAEPGMYGNVALLDIASMHPTSIRVLNMFGSYTKNFTDILDARLAIKHGDFDTAGELLNGAFKPYLKDKAQAKQLAQALKIIINSVYGYTSATFDNPFKDVRNVDNIVAKRGALFMINLKHEVQERGFTVAHIKTDSIKIPDATPEIIEFVMNYGKQYGYTFEHEATYEKMCLVNDAVYIAKYKDGDHEFELSTGEKIMTPWTATGTPFQIPYVFKTLFARKDITLRDMCETKSTSTSLYLDKIENLEEGEEHSYQFIGKVGLFVPVKEGVGGGLLMREEKDGRMSAATGTKGYRWIESEVFNSLLELGKISEKDIDRSYYIRLVDEAKETISQHGDFEWFVYDSYEEPPFVGGKVKEAA